LATELGISHSTVARVWAEHDLKPWQTEPSKFSTDPEKVNGGNTTATATTKGMFPTFDRFSRLGWVRMRNLLVCVYGSRLALPGSPER
jgi:hypothetical protein